MATHPPHLEQAEGVMVGSWLSTAGDIGVPTSGSPLSSAGDT
jgi:hypothetical protein